MKTANERTRWRKSSFSAPNGDCVEIERELTQLRDSKNPAVVLTLPRESVASLLRTLGR